MAKKINPFIVTGEIEPQYFCKRAQVSARPMESIANGNNTFIIAPRSMGKSRLIPFCYAKPKIKENKDTLLIDVLHTSGLRELTFLLSTRDSCYRDKQSILC